MKNKIFYNHPHLFSVHQYNQAKESVVTKFKGNKNLRAIFEYGSLNNVGISDLDIIVILQNQISYDCSKSISKDVLPKKTLSIIDFASLIILPEENFNQILIWDNLRLNKIYGEEIKINKYISQEIEIARIIDWLPERIIRLEETITSDKINVRKTLGLLKSSCYTLKNLINKFNLSIESFKILIKRVNALRSNWFLLDKNKGELLLMELLLQTKKNLLLGLDLFDNWLSDYYNPDLLKEGEGIVLEFPKNFSYVFKTEIDQRLIKSNNDGIKLCLSNFYLYHFLTYSLQNGLISKTIKESFNKIISSIYIERLPKEYREILIKRINLCNEWAYYLRTNNFKNGLFKMGWFYNN